MTSVITIIPREEETPLYEMKGMPLACVTNGDSVQLWVRSATGDSSDSHVFTIPCVSEAQAKQIAETYALVFGF